MRQIRREEIVVLEIAEQPEIRREAHYQRNLSRPLRRCRRDPAGGRVVDRGQCQQKQDELRNPAHVEEIAGAEQDKLAPGTWRGIEQNQDNREEGEELRSIKQHTQDLGGPSTFRISTARIFENRSRPLRLRCHASWKNSGRSNESKRCSSSSTTLGSRANRRTALFSFGGSSGRGTGARGTRRKISLVPDPR